MLPDRVSNPGPLTYESGALPIALRGPARGPGRAILLPSALAAASALAKCKSFYVKVIFMSWTRRCQASYPAPVTGLV